MINATYFIFSKMCFIFASYMKHFEILSRVFFTVQLSPFRSFHPHYILILSSFYPLYSTLTLMVCRVCGRAGCWLWSGLSFSSLTRLNRHQPIRGQSSGHVTSVTNQRPVCILCCRPGTEEEVIFRGGNNMSAITFVLSDN